jgi:hypothetical protein
MAIELMRSLYTGKIECNNERLKINTIGLESYGYLR